MPDPTPQKKKAPALDQSQAMAVHIPGALSAPAPVIVEPPAPAAAPPPVPVVGDPPAATPVGVDLADVRPSPPAAPMLVDVPIDLSPNVPGAEPNVGRPASDAHKDEWAAWAISRGVPSYEAWALTIPELKKMEA